MFYTFIKNLCCPLLTLPDNARNFSAKHSVTGRKVDKSSDSLTFCVISLLQRSVNSYSGKLKPCSVWDWLSYPLNLLPFSRLDMTFIFYNFPSKGRNAIKRRNKNEGVSERITSKWQVELVTKLQEAIVVFSRLKSFSHSKTSWMMYSMDVLRLFLGGLGKELLWLE